MNINGSIGPIKNKRIVNPKTLASREWNRLCVMAGIKQEDQGEAWIALYHASGGQSIAEETALQVLKNEAGLVQATATFAAGFPERPNVYDMDITQDRRLDQRRDEEPEPLELAGQAA